jgi:hypothetical protein
MVAPSSLADTITTGQIEQDQIDVGIPFQQRGQFVERPRLADHRRTHHARYRLPQGVAEQWMVIGDDEVGVGGGGHLRLAGSQAR